MSNRDSLLRDALSQSAPEHTHKRQAHASTLLLEGKLWTSWSVQTFADGIVLNVDPQAVARLFRGSQSQVYQDAEVGAQRTLEGLLLLVARQSCLQQRADACVLKT